MSVTAVVKDGKLVTGTTSIQPSTTDNCKSSP